MSDAVVSSSWAVDRFGEIPLRTEQAESIVHDEDDLPPASAGSRSSTSGTIGSRVATLRRYLPRILDAQSFPADRWELIMTAELYGADFVARNALYDLPERRFRTLGDVLLAVERNQSAR